MNTLYGLVFGPDGHLYVSSFRTDQVLRYDGKTGDFLDPVVSAGSGGLDRPAFLVFLPSAPPLFGCVRVQGHLLVGATVEFEQGNTHTTTTDTQGCYRFDGVNMSQPGTITISVPAQP